MHGPVIGRFGDVEGLIESSHRGALLFIHFVFVLLFLFLFLSRFFICFVGVFSALVLSFCASRLLLVIILCVVVCLLSR